MEKRQAIREKMLQDVSDLDGGWHLVSEKTGYSQQFLQRVLNPKNTQKTRLSTLEKIKAGILAAQQEEEKRAEALLA